MVIFHIMPPGYLNITSQFNYANFFTKDTKLFGIPPNVHSLLSFDVDPA